MPPGAGLWKSESKFIFFGMKISDRGQVTIPKKQGGILRKRSSGGKSTDQIIEDKEHPEYAK